MKLKNWLIVKSNGSVRITKNKPSLDADEVTIQLNLDVPDILFQKPHLEATVVVPESAVNKNPISSEVVAAAKESIEQATGIEFNINIVENENGIATTPRPTMGKMRKRMERDK